MRSTGWRRYLLGGLVVVAGHALLPPGFARDLLGVVLAATAVVVVAVGIRWFRPVAVLPWALLAVGMSAWVVGDLIWAVLARLDLDPFPSAADGLYLFGYAALAGAVYQFSRSRNPGGDRRGMLDAFVVGASITLVMVVLFIEPAWTAEGSLVGRVVGVAYPVGDLMLLVQLAHLRTAGSGRHPALRFLSLGLLVTLAADLLFLSAAYIPWLAENLSVIDSGWLVGYLFLGVAAVHPTMAAATALQPAGVYSPSLTSRQLLYNSLTITVIPLTLAIEVLAGADPHLFQAAVAGGIVVWLVHFRMVGMTREMTQHREYLAHLADADALTGLANRRRFTEEVGLRLADPRVADVPVLLIVLNRFTEINDTLGHRVGDELLRAAAERTTSVVAERGLVGRVGGDSFAVVVEDPDHCREGVTACAAILREALMAPFVLSDVTVSIDALVGIAVGPKDGADPEELLQRADVALSVARDRMEGVARYTGTMSSDGVLAAHLVGELSAALEAGDIVVHYQPQVLLATGKVVGVEALVRWQHPVHGLLPPIAFIPAAERTGLIRPLTLYVLNRALEQVARWRVNGLGLSVAVNLSVRDLLDPQFVEDVRQAIHRHGVAEHALELEITETMAMVDPKRSVLALEALRAMGVTLSLDDYGTGYSSLVYLQRLPVQRLKIDRSFIAHLLDDRASAAIVASTIELARHLGMTVVAEGVEDDATLLALRDLSCDVAQGFGLGRPVTPEAIPDLVRLIEKHVPRALNQRVPVGRRIV